MKRPFFLFSLALLPLLPACVPVQIAVPEPVKIDVNMKVDVTSHEGAPAPGATAPPSAGAAGSTNAPSAAGAAADPLRKVRGLDVVADATADRATPAGAAGDLRKLSGDLQSFKNDRLVGENNQGYLEVRQKADGKLPSGEDYAAYVQRLVDEANADRKVIYQARADKSGDPLQTHEKDGAQRRRDSAFAGEWVQDPNGTWAQKK